MPSLFLALGALAWRDPGTPGTERLAPLALVPATLERAGVSQRFTLRADAREAQENLSLREKLLVEFNVALPEFDADSYDPTQWAEAVGQAVAGRAEWRAEPDAIAVGLFSFNKFLLWRDLDPRANPGLLESPLVRALVGGEPLPPQPPAFPDDADVDAEIPVERLDHALEVDGSQALAVEAVRRGGHLVIQGPPGTGKSQTIVNILAQAVLDGRSVLFVAEKAAALEVVKRRLDNLGLGAAVLELHSEKQSKRAVLDELRATLAAPARPAPDPGPVVRRLAELRGRLNRHAAQMRAAAGNSGMPVHEVVGRIAALRAAGEGPPPFALDAAAWDAERLRGLRGAAEDLAARAAAGAPSSPWRGVSPELDALSAERLMARLPGLIRAFVAAPGGPGDAERAEAAEAARARFAHPAWAGDLAPLDALVRDLEQVQAARRDPRLKPSALDLPGVEEARDALRQSGGLLGFLSSARREAQALLARVSDDAEGVEVALAARAARARLRGGEAFGALWQGERSDAAALRAVLAERRAIARAEWERPPPSDAQRAALAAWRELRGATGLEAGGDGFAPLAERLAAWASEPEALALWQGWARAAQAAPELAPLVALLDEGALPPEAAVPAFERAALESLLRAALRDNPALAAFDGAAMDRLVAGFREADAERVRLTRALAAARHAAALARIRAGEVPGLNILRGEFEKKRGHMPVRALLAAAGPLVKAAKPILMMSPLSVAQFLQPTTGLRPGLAFDLLVMDEASQIEPVDALGAIARARQMVVVGDDRQMPPTRFFQRVTSEEEGDESAGAPDDAPVAAREVESVLGLANARGVPRAMLRWHYRSRHESLIATSNAEFYDHRLLVLPSPRPRSPLLGLSLVRVEGRFDTGGTGTNAAEAEAVAAAVLRHARETPGDTLGVAAFSVRQRDAIAEAVEKLRRDSAETEPFFAAHGAEPFFVKNLENVQGDERDAILISVAYGRGADGKVAMRFGPLSGEGGERRLNVLITRAKKRCVVFSGIGAEDIDLARAGGRGVAALKAFLGFAAASDAARALAAEAGSPLAACIGAVVAEAGLEAVKRVGLSGLYLDVGARDATGYALGVETDGADWAALRCARDRDRGRQLALAGMGWKLARSWSLDWLNRPQAAAAALRAALGSDQPAAPTAAAPPADPGLARPYVETAPDGPAPTTAGGVAELLARIVATEAPIHRDAAAERARLLLGAAAPDARGLAAALKEAVLLHGLVEKAGFLRPEGTPAEAPPRDRRGVSLALLRRAAMVAPEEIAAAAAALRGVQPRASEEELAAGVVRLLALEPAAQLGVMARLALLSAAEEP